MSTFEAYEFTVEEDDNSDICYYFATSNIVCYTVYFKPDEYTKYVQDFPNLLDKNCAFGFYGEKAIASKGNFNDHRVLGTLRLILKHFFNHYGEDCVLLYQCDNDDGRQACRDRLFNNWGKLLSPENLMERYSLKAETPNRDYYIGFLTLPSNPHLEIMRKEFDGFSQHMIAKS